MSRRRKDIVRKRPGSPYWHYSWTIDGDRIRGSCDTNQKDLAVEIALREREKHIKRIRLGIDADAEAEAKRKADGVDITLAAACARTYGEHWQFLETSRDIRPAQCKTLMRIIGPATPLSEIDDDCVRDFVALRRGECATAGGRTRKSGIRRVSASTVNRELDALGTVINRARGAPNRPGWKVDGAPVKVAAVDLRAHRLKEGASRVYLPRDRAIQLLDVIVPHARGPVTFALLTGLRRSNVLELDWDWIDLSMRRVVLAVKGGKTHTVSLIDEAVALLEGIEPDPARRRGRVFRFGNPAVGCDCRACHAEDDRFGAPMNSIKRAWDTARKAIGMPRLRFHDLRHTVASWLLGRGYTLEHIGRVLGHADIETTRTYAHLEQQGLADAMTDSLTLKGTNKTQKGAA